MVQQESGNAFEVGGVEQATMDAFSVRTRGQIDPELRAEAAEYERLHGRPPSARTLWEWRQHIARSTRKAKQPDPPAGPERLAAWEQHSKDVNVQILSDLHDAVSIYQATHAPPAALTPGQRARTIRIAVHEVQSRHAAFTASQLLWELHRALPVLPAGTDPVPLLEQMAADALTGKADDVDIVLLNPAPGGLDVDYLGVRASDGQSIYRAPCEKKYATVGHLDAEQHILSQAAKGRPRLVHPERAEAAVAAAGQLSRDQAAALQALLTSDKAMTLVRAAAGTGKTRLAGAFAKAWAELTGGLVYAVTVSENAARVAAQEMENAGAPALSYNLARFLGKTPGGATVNPVQVGPRDVILLDEAGQVDTADLLKLQATADQAGARIVPVGDEFQLGAINAGGMFPLLADRLGALEIHEVHRFAEQWEKDASLKLRHGDVTVIADYQARGRVHAGREDQARRDMVLDWAAAIRAGLDALMIAQSEAEVTELNRLAAEHMARARTGRRVAARHRAGQAQRRQPGPGRRLDPGPAQRPADHRRRPVAGQPGHPPDHQDLRPRPRPADRSAAAAAGRDLDGQVHPPGQVRGEIRHPGLRLHHLRRAGPHRRCRARTGHPGPEPGSAVRAGDPGTPGEPAARGHRPRTQRAAGRA